MMAGLLSACSSPSNWSLIALAITQFSYHGVDSNADTKLSQICCCCAVSSVSTTASKTTTKDPCESCVTPLKYCEKAGGVGSEDVLRARSAPSLEACSEYRGPSIGRKITAS